MRFLDKIVMGDDPGSEECNPTGFVVPDLELMGKDVMVRNQF